jgi:hypothetical protein
VVQELGRFRGEFHREAMSYSDLVGQHLFERVAGFDRIDSIDRQIERAAVGGQFQAGDTG